MGSRPKCAVSRFLIFINPDSQGRSCIVFRIGIHVDLEADKVALERQDPRLELELTTVGSRPATLRSSVGSANGTVYENVKVWLQVPHKNEDIHDVEIVLVTPKDDAMRSRAIFERFLASFRFL